MDLRQLFAANLRRLRHERGLAQDDLAYEAEVSRSYLKPLEKRTFYASLKILEKLAKALGVDIYELIAPPPKKSPLKFFPASLAHLASAGEPLKLLLLG